VVLGSTRSLFFSDIEASTALLKRSGDGYAVLVGRHREIVRGAITRFSGVEHGTEGDSFFATFGSPVAAIRAAIEVQLGLQHEAWPNAETVRARIGVHIGDVSQTPDGLFGVAIHHAARIMAAAHGGQIVVSEQLYSLARGEPDLDFRLLGRFQLRDVGSVPLFQVVRPDLADGFPALRASSDSRTNLPLRQTSLIGRQRQIAEILDLAVRSPLVTLTGPGGVGKTRLAVEVGRMSLDLFPDGAWLVELAPIADQGVVIAAVAASLSVQVQPGLTLVASIVDWLRGRRLLLILDNCEHVLSPVAELTSAVVTGCETVTVVATSREPLGLAEERVVSVASLALVDAVELFRERATAFDDSLVFSAQDVAVIGAICERLDGIPLAIELAAARVRSLTITDLAARLDDRFRLLRGSGRAGLERHQTLRAAVGWSYQLLVEAERVLFDRVSVFAGGFDLNAAESICADELVDVDEILDLLSSLVDKSMVIADRGGQSTRYRQLETLRQYGEERLADRGDMARVRDRHLNHYAAITREARALEMGPRQLDGEAAFDDEWDNLRAAVAWGTVSGGHDTADDILYYTASYAFHRIRLEHVEWVKRLLATGREGATRPSRICEGAAAFALTDGDWDGSIALCRRGIAENSDPDYVADCWQTMANAFFGQGLVEEARQALEAAEAAGSHTNDPYVKSWLLFGRAIVTSGVDLNAMPAAVAQLSEYAHRIAAPWMLITALQMQAHLCLINRDFDEALVASRAAYALARSTRSVFDEGAAGGAIIAAIVSAEAAPTPECRQILTRLHDTRNWFRLWLAIESIANNLARIGHAEEAATIMGYLDTHIVALPGMGRSIRDHTLEIVRQQVDGREWMDRGAGMDRDELVTYVLDQLPG
jgi:predicted ATPase/class 3 adenylate cyclase